MSGLVGILNLDGAPIDNSLLSRMTDFLAFRGPDGHATWSQGNVGFGHTLLKTTDESEHERQPFSFDQKSWIVADARIDAQAELISKLQGKGHRVSSGVTDAELILRAYSTWGPECIEHLLGDFAFGIWDDAKKSLFCARDHLGVKPFFYAEVNNSVIFSNTLDCVRQHPLVSNELNDQAIADFLLFGVNQESGTTAFTHINRLAPATYAQWMGDAKALRRYWTLEIEGPVYFKHLNEYTERLLHLLDKAVGDRLRTNRVGLFMSGGLDSPTLAATSLKLLRSRPDGYFLQAFTSVYDGGGPDPERQFVDLISRHLGIPIQYDVRDHEKTIEELRDVNVRTPEPVGNPMAFLASVEFYKKAGALAPVLFYGEGPDNALKYEWRPHLSYLAKKGQWARLVKDVAIHVASHRRVPLLPSIPQMIRVKTTAARAPEIPTWLNPELISRLELRARLLKRCDLTNSHPVRPRAHHNFQSPLWQSLFEDCDINGSHGHTEVRHPFVDLRVLSYLLAVPAIPWCRKKYILRRGMKGILPDAVLRRKKTGLADIAQPFRRTPPVFSSAYLERYVDQTRVPDVTQNEDELDSKIRALSLSYWLRSLENEEKGQEIIHDTTKKPRTC
jgi:asparagine synthase (glutamine-hydrolysing)